MPTKNTFPLRKPVICTLDQKLLILETQLMLIDINLGGFCRKMYVFTIGLLGAGRRTEEKISIFSVDVGTVAVASAHLYRTAFQLSDVSNMACVTLWGVGEPTSLLHLLLLGPE
jgi:hypothetical protein